MVGLIRTSELIRTTFWQFPSYELAQHPCSIEFLMFISKITIRIVINTHKLFLRSNLLAAESTSQRHFNRSGRMRFQSG